MASNAKSDLVTREAYYLDLLSDRNVAAVTILRPLVDGLSGASTDLVEVISRDDTQEVLQVFKLGPADAIRREADGTLQAARLMPQSARMDLFDVILPDGGTEGLLRFRLAGQAPSAGGFESLSTFVERTPDVAEAADVLRCALRAGARARQPWRRRHSSLERLRRHCEDARRSPFWAAIERATQALLDEGDLVRHSRRPTRLTCTFPFKTLHDPFQDTPRARSAWRRSMPGAIASATHGDFNPRNILVTYDGSRPMPVIIDFHRFGSPGPLPLDFCRLEVGLQIKGLRTFLDSAAGDDEAEEQLSRYEKWINDHDALEREDAAAARRADGPRELMRTARLVGAVRETYFDEIGRDTALTRQYFGCLLLCYFNYLRPTYADALSPRQRLFAFYCGARIFKRHFLYPGPV